MERVIKKFSKKEVNRAGEILKENDPNHPDIVWAESVLTNWRSIHSYPINTFQATLREKLKHIDEKAFVAQRLKRSQSIILKLQRTESMQLSRMQDIAGLRAILSNIKKVRELETNYRNSHFNHELVNQKDYITEPKESGYRGIHLVYKYMNDHVPDYNGLRIELQIRTKLQHIWATSVETVGTFLDHSLKSSEGPREWLDFFSLVASAFAYIEKCTPIAKYSQLNEKQTFQEVIRVSKILEVEKKLSAYTVAASAISQDVKQGNYHLITLNLLTRRLNIRNFGRKRLEEANEQYTKIEKEINEGKPLQVVLVSADSVETLRRAYPNYFLDTREFIGKLLFIEKNISKGRFF